MIGNDVVDLALARRESNWQRKGFMKKIFTQEEQHIILKSDDSETCVWILWSMKEAAYKIYNRQTGIRAFIPHQLECSLVILSQNKAEGTVRLGTNTYFTRTEIQGDIIHTMAVYNTKVEAKIYKINDESIQKDDYGFPFVQDKSGLIIPVSKSHHGRSEIVVSY